MLKLIADIPNPFSPSQNDKFTKFKGVLIKMLAKNPKDRSSSDEIINGLSQIII
jgi:serine/threonine protein kinase